MSKIVIITGANRGLGKALADLALKQMNVTVVSISRTVHKDHEPYLNHQFHLIKTDLAQPFNLKSFKKMESLATENSVTSFFFFNNASVIIPIKKVGDFNELEIMASININVTFPVLLINYLIRTFGKNKLSFVNITSGAADKIISFWSLYSSSKSYLKVFFNIMEEENKLNTNFSFFNIDPGTLDTGMQNDIRSADFPNRNYFDNLKINEELTKPEIAAKNILTTVNFN